MIARDLKDELLRAAADFPVVTLFGPRQSGKTTLVRSAFPRKPYRSLEEPDLRAAAETDPRGFLAQLPDGAVLDEIQHAPGLLSYIQGIVDATPHKGMFILTGSHQPLLSQSVAQSLAGRTAVLTLLPFSLQELRRYRKPLDAFDLIVRGAFPRLHHDNILPRRFYPAYVRTYVERDVRAIVNIRDLRRFQQFLTLLAGRIGQVVNYSSLGNDLGVSSMTVKNWVSVLLASFVVFELPPYFENVGKRVVKSPKVYFTDTGMACYLLGLSDPRQVQRDPLRGGLYENLMILEILKQRLNAGREPDLFFYRDARGNEVDLLLRRGRALLPIEIKSAATFTTDFLHGIESFTKAAGARALPGYVLYNGPAALRIKGHRVFNPLLHTTRGILPSLTD